MIALRYAIAIAGGIASGKSSVCNLLKLYGYSIIDADKIAHNALDVLKDEVVASFGSEIMESGNINRKKLGNIIFGDNAKKSVLEGILHPFIRSEILQRAHDLERYGKPYFIDIPLFFEVKEKYKVPRILLIYTPRASQIQRLIKRDGISESMALKRIESQMDIESKRALSTDIIDNSRDFAYTKLQVEELLRTL